MKLPKFSKLIKIQQKSGRYNFHTLKVRDHEPISLNFIPKIFFGLIILLFVYVAYGIGQSNSLSTIVEKNNTMVIVKNGQCPQVINSGESSCTLEELDRLEQENVQLKTKISQLEANLNNQNNKQNCPTVDVATVCSNKFNDYSETDLIARSVASRVNSHIHILWDDPGYLVQVVPGAQIGSEAEKFLSESVDKEMKTAKQTKVQKIDNRTYFFTKK